MSQCDAVRKQFSGYLDGAVSGTAMQQIASHLEACAACTIEFSDTRKTVALLGTLAPVKAPPDLALRLRVAVSHELANTPQQNLARWTVRWQNTLRPLVLQASTGLASAILLIGSVALLVGMFATPEPLSARDEPLGMATSPRFLYTTLQPSTGLGDNGNPVLVQAFVNGEGRVYDYRIVSGSSDAATRAQVANTLLFSVFEPARAFGEPVRGTVLLAFSDVSVHG